MPSETVKPNPPSSEGDKNRQLSREIKEMVSTLTKNLVSLHKPGSSHELGDENEHGLGIITLAGTNNGAIMRGDLLGDRNNKHQPQQNEENQDDDDDEVEGSDIYVNSNYQAVNNSIMLSASYTSNDPGVHLDITEFVDPYNHTHDRHARRAGRKGKEVVGGGGEGGGGGNPHSDYSE